jgi:CBS domain-containing protein
MIIATILQRKGGQVFSVNPDDTIHQVAVMLAQHRIGAALVNDPAGGMLGIISERDIVRGMAGQGQGTTQLLAKHLMTRSVITVTPQEMVTTALALMTDRRVRHLPVMEGTRVAGMVSIGDLVKARIEETELEAAELKNYVATAG